MPALSLELAGADGKADGKGCWQLRDAGDWISAEGISLRGKLSCSQNLRELDSSI